MKNNRREFLQAAGAVLSASPLASGEVYAPAPYGPVPTKGQMQWSALEYYNFLHSQ